MKPNIMLLENEKILFECHPQKKLALYLLITKSIHLLLVFVVMSIVFFTQLRGDLKLSPEEAMNAFIIALIIIFVVMFGAYFWFRSVISRHWYFFTNQRAILYSGFLGINKRIMTYNRIVDVDLNQNVLHSLLGIAAVNIAEQSTNASIVYSLGNAASSRLNTPSATNVTGITLEEAEQLTHLISEQCKNAQNHQ